METARGDDAIIIVDDDGEDAAVAASGDAPDPHLGAGPALGPTDRVEEPVDSGAEGRRITDAQRAARRRNGARSRGPRTDAGKATSRLNALKHGGYERSFGVISQGPLAEDPEEYAEFCADVVASLPGADNSLLAELGHVVAHALWRNRRTTLWETTRLNRESLDCTCTSEESEHAIKVCDLAIEILEDNPDLTHVAAQPAVWAHLSWLLSDHPAIHPQQWPHGEAYAVAALQPEEWQRTFLAFLHVAFDDDHERCIDWLEERRRQEQENLDYMRELGASVAVDELMRSTGAFNTLMRVGAHQSTEVRKALDQYKKAYELLQP